MATHSRILAWRIPWTEAPGGQGSMRSVTHRVGHNWATKHRQTSTHSQKPEEPLLYKWFGSALLGTGRQCEVELGKSYVLKGEITYGHTVFWTPTASYFMEMFERALSEDIESSQMNSLLSTWLLCHFFFFLFHGHTLWFVKLVTWPGIEPRTQEWNP